MWWMIPLWFLGVSHLGMFFQHWWIWFFIHVLCALSSSSRNLMLMRYATHKLIFQLPPKVFQHAFLFFCHGGLRLSFLYFLYSHMFLIIQATFDYCLFSNNIWAVFCSDAISVFVLSNSWSIFLCSSGHLLKKCSRSSSSILHSLHVLS